MPKGMQAIYSLNVVATSIGITFNNIPQNYTDLLVHVSARDSFSANYALASAMYFNGNGATNFYGNLVMRNISNSPSSFAANNYSSVYSYTNANSVTINTFTSSSHYIPDYSSNKFKQILTESAPEGDVTGYDSMNFLNASLFRSNAPITSISFSPAGGGYMPHSSFTLYGIAK